MPWGKLSIKIHRSREKICDGEDFYKSSLG